MKKIKKISILMAIFTVTPLSFLISKPGMPGNEKGAHSSEESSSVDTQKLIGAKVLLGPGGGGGGKSSGMGGMAMMAGMASSSQDSGSGGSGSSGGSGGSTPPTTPTTPVTPPPADLAGQQYAAAPNTGVPTTNSSTTPATTPGASTETPAASSEKKVETPEGKTAKTQESTMNEDQKNIVEDQDSILHKIQEINTQDLHVQNIVSQASMELLFNNFVYFKNFIVQNFSKEKMLSLCNEFINQIYPNDHVKVISINDPHAIPSDSIKPDKQGAPSIPDNADEQTTTDTNNDTPNDNSFASTHTDEQANEEPQEQLNAPAHDEEQNKNQDNSSDEENAQ